MVAVVAACVAAPSPGAAFAHTHLTRTSPAGGAAVAEPPEQVELDFNEPVELRDGALRVFDEYGKRVDAGGVFRPGGRDRSVGVRLRGGLGPGAYSAAYRVVADDGHPVAGWFAFGVAASGGSSPPQPAAPPPAVRAELDASANPVVEALHGLARLLNDGALMLIVGALAFRALVWRPEAGERRWPARLVMRAAVTGMAAALAGLPLQGTLAAGAGPGALLDPGVLGDSLSSRAGQAWAVRLVLWELLVLLVIRSQGKASRIGVVALAVPATLLVATVPLGGHAAGAGPAGLLVAADLVHVLAAGAWLGTLVLLLAAYWPRPDAPDAPGVAATRRFSSLALGAMALLAVAGLVQAWLYLGSPAGLVKGTYGLVLLLKLVLLVAIVLLASRNRRRLSRLPARAPALALRQAMRAEVALAVLVLAATAVLVGTSPPA